MKTLPNCKINIGLKILEKRNDGFHEIETTFYPVNLYDTLEINEVKVKTTIQITGLDINEDVNNNLCMKAYKLLVDDYKLPHVKINLHKQIPVGAGLGGGSSDAAFTIMLLNQLFSLSLSNDKMKEYASKLGSDCPFFIDNKPALAYGTGNQFSNIDLNLKNYYILIVKPDFSINTKKAYEIYDSKHKTSDCNPQTAIHTTPCSQLPTIPIYSWKDLIINDFEKVIFPKYPELNVIKEKLYNSGAVYASMSGSGSAIYGIFSSKPNEKLFNNYNFVWNGILQ